MKQERRDTATLHCYSAACPPHPTPLPRGRRVKSGVGWEGGDSFQAPTTGQDNSLETQPRDPTGYTEVHIQSLSSEGVPFTREAHSLL